MREIKLSNAEVGPLRRAIERSNPWLLAIATCDWPGARVGDRVHLYFPGDSPGDRPPHYPPGEWRALVTEVRTIRHANEITPEDMEAIFGFRETNRAYAAEIWRAAAGRRDVHALHLVRFDFSAGEVKPVSDTTSRPEAYAGHDHAVRAWMLANGWPVSQVGFDLNREILWWRHQGLARKFTMRIEEDVLADTSADILSEFLRAGDIARRLYERPEAYSVLQRLGHSYALKQYDHRDEYRPSA